MTGNNTRTVYVVERWHETTCDRCAATDVDSYPHNRINHGCASYVIVGRGYASIAAACRAAARIDAAGFAVSIRKREMRGNCIESDELVDGP